MAEFVLTALIIGQLAFTATIYHKLSKAIQYARHEATRNADNVITQIEGLMAVYAEVSPSRALPRSRRWAASPDVLALMIHSVQRHVPQQIVECSSGFSTLVLAASLRNLGAGHLWSLEHDSSYAKESRRLLTMHGLSEWATVLDAPLISYELEGWHGDWYDVSGLPDELSIDLLAIDGPPDELGPLARYPAVPILHTMLPIGAIVLLDDSDRLAEQQSTKRWLHEFPNLRAVAHRPCEKGCAVFEITRYPSSQLPVS